MIMTPLMQFGAWTVLIVCFVLLVLVDNQLIKINPDHQNKIVLLGLIALMLSMPSLNSQNGVVRLW